MAGRSARAEVSWPRGGSVLVGDSDGSHPSQPGAGYKSTGNTLPPPSGLYDSSKLVS